MFTTRPGHASRRDVLRARAREPHELVSSRARSSRRRCAHTCAAPRPRRRRIEPRRTRRTASSRAARRQPGERGADAGLGRRLRALGLRHGRDHGGARARRARHRVRAERYGLPRSARSSARGRGDRRGRPRTPPTGERGARQLRRRRRTAEPRGGRRIVEWLAERKAWASRRSATGCATGCFSRQRYWGCPIPIVYCDACGRSRSRTTSFPSCCRRYEDYKPRRAAAARAAEDWVNMPARAAAGRDGARPRRWTRSSTRPGTSCATADVATTRPPFVARRSSTTGTRSTSTSAAIEHAVMHMLYARFFTKVMNDLGYVRVPRAVRAALLEPGG